MPFTQEQVLQLAPDDASAKAGCQLASTSRWLSRSAHPQALWGECRGSGSSPYVTMVDLTNVAFKCSCPSRKFPCKHGIGLLLLYVNDADAFEKKSEIVPPVAEWLHRRAGKSEAKTQNKPPDEAAQRKRADARTRKVEGGIAELRAWLKDVVRTGILSIPQNPYHFNRNIIARMVDAQAGGLAARLRAMNKINFYKEGWQKLFIRHLANAYLLTEAYQNLQTVSDDLKQEIPALIGWNTPKEQVLALPPVYDRWAILSRTMEEENNLRTERIWLYGNTSERFALLLNFYTFNQQPEHLYLPGFTLEAHLVFYPSAQPLRALVKESVALHPAFTPLSGTPTLRMLHEQITEVLLKNPFAERIPVLVSQVKLGLQGKTWVLIDGENRSLPLANTEDESWNMLAVSRGQPFSCFALHENGQLDIHAVWMGNHHELYGLK
jgi:hypothetical protein